VSCIQKSLIRRIAVISTSYPSDIDDSAGHFVKAEVDHYLSEGHHVTLFVPRAYRHNRVPGLRIVELCHLGAFGAPGAIARLRWRPDRWLGVLLFVILARRALRHYGSFDFGVAHFLVPSFWPICSNFSASLEAVVHGSDLHLLEKLPRVKRQLILRGFNSEARTVRCVSTNLAQRLVRLIGEQFPISIRVAPSPIAVPTHRGKQAQREALGIGPESLVVIVARLIRSKRVDVALQAATLLPTAKVVVCGDGPERRRLKQRFPDVTFCGHLPRAKVLEWIAASDLVLCASRAEGAPTVVREARALGVPVVATAAGDLESWAQTDAGLWIVP
jgi:glycosyltransferase involved in cell wall biosynthesis